MFKVLMSGRQWDNECRPHFQEIAWKRKENNNVVDRGLLVLYWEPFFEGRNIMYWTRTQTVDPDCLD